MGLDNINDRPVQPNPLIDREVAPGTEDLAEVETQTTFENSRSYMEEMLEMNYGVIQELLGQIAAINPFRLDMVQGKQPDIAAAEIGDDIKSAPVAPVGKSSAAAYINGLQQVNNVFSNHDMKLQQVFDQMALSRSGRKPDLYNHGVEYNKLLTMVRQAEMRLHQLDSYLPETLPKHTGQTLQDLMPEFTQALYQYDASLQLMFASVLEEIQQSKIRAKAL